jgi:hypothetical protein
MGTLESEKETEREGEREKTIRESERTRKRTIKVGDEGRKLLLSNRGKGGT